MPSRSRGAPRSLRGVFGWLTDTFRLGWGALYWNTRKSWHIARGRRGPCPCQVSSDSGRAMETGCEGVLGYRSPRRFRTVCPLLVRRADGQWLCSVSAGEVRPFWGRAALFFGAGALLAALVASLAIFALLRGIGYDIAYRQVAWPPAWNEFRQVQADYYLGKARHAATEGAMSEVLLSLSNAYEINRDYRTGMALAQLWQAGQPVLSDQTYARVFADHPEHRAEIAENWYRALLSRGDFRAIQRVSGERLLHSGPTPANAWLHAFLFATRQIGNPAGLAHLLEEPDLPDTLRPLFELELRLHSQTTAERVASLGEAAARANSPFAAYHLLRRLLEERRGDLVLSLLTSGNLPIADRDNARLRLDALAGLGRMAERASVVRQLLARPTHPAICELLSAHLIVFPDLALMRDYDAKLAAEPIPAGDAVYPQLLGAFVAAGVHRDATLIRNAGRRVQAAAGREFRTLAAIEDLFIKPPSNLRPANFLTALQPLPLDISYALFTHYEPPPPLPTP